MKLLTIKQLVALLYWLAEKSAGIIPLLKIIWLVWWVPVMYFGLSIAYVSVAMAYGINEANDFWENAN